MGWTVHHAIIVTSFSEAAIQKAYTQARALFLEVSPPIESASNGWWSLFIPPDGSKEGWPDSDTGDAQRAEFAGWIRHQRYGLTMIEVAYGEVEQPVIVRVDGEDTGAQYQSI